MKVKRYIGKTTQEAIQKVKDDLGKEAIILHTRRIRKKGLWGWFTKPLIEVVAAIDEAIETENPKEQNNLPPTPSSLSNRNFTKESDTYSSKKIPAIEQSIEKKNSQIPSQAAAESEGLDAEWLPFYSQLINKEIHPKIAKAIIQEASLLAETDSTNKAHWVKKILSKYLIPPQPLDLSSSDRKIVIFLGPTGVGKTTTLAKLAAIFSINYHKSVGMITADTYRIAATDQLKTYAEILGIPLTIIYSPKEVEEALKQYTEKQIVLIDTAGKSPKNEEQDKEIRELINRCTPDEVYLVISVNTSYQSYERIISNYSYINNFKLIFTKMDEAVSYGMILNSCYLSGKPMSYVTTGQSVPDDIEIANIDGLLDHLLENVRS